MRKYRVVLGLAALSILQLLELANKIITALTGNASVPSPSPTLAALTAAVNKLIASRTVVDNLKTQLATAVVLQNNDVRDLKNLLTAEGITVDGIAQGDKAIIESCGMKATDDPNTVHLDQVTDLSLTRGDDLGEVDAHWHKVKNAVNYSIETSLTAPDNAGSAPWVFYNVSSKSSFTLIGQTVGHGLWVRVRANGTESGPWSQFAFIVVS